MPLLRSTTAFLASRALLLVGPLALAACMHATEFTHYDGTIREDGYALFEVKNDRAQNDDVVVHVGDVTPGTTYVLLYSDGAPTSSGWFQLDPKTHERCGGSPGPHCDVGDGFGYMVDVVTVPDGATEVVLRHGVCGCGGDRDDRRHREWSAYYAVMRVERTGDAQFVKVEVTAHEIDGGFAETPEVHQLQ